ncbi:MAG: dihydropteroate synthase [Verrucomicrobiota bacterium]|jgi:dihydropteroate synthase
MLLRARQFEFAFPRPALLMGIVNATPDSFYDGGRFARTEAAVAHALQLAAEGADIIDIGGESSRPKAEPVSEAEELRRVIPVLEGLAGAVSVPLSIDTVKPAVARAALRAGASIINDIAANREGDEMWRLAAESGAAYVAVHMQGSPATMQDNPRYDDVVLEVDRFFEDRLKRLRDCGVNAEQVVLDVGLGFGKRPGENLRLLAELGRFTKWGRPLLLGASRKSFMGAVVGAGLEERLPPSLACACWAVENGGRIIRCHDVAATRQAVRMTEALMQQQTNAEHSTLRR